MSQKSIIFNATIIHEVLDRKTKRKTALIDQRRAAPLVKSAILSSSNYIQVR